jgi:hypothetical protein
MKKAVVCKFQVQSLTNQVLSRKYSTGGCAASQEGDTAGQVGVDRSGEYRVVSERNVSMMPVYGDYNDPESENFKFFTATPAGQIQFFNTINLGDLVHGQHVRVTLEFDLPDAE